MLRKIKNREKTESAILYRMLREGLSDKVTYDYGPEGSQAACEEEGHFSREAAIQRPWGE